MMAMLVATFMARLMAMLVSVAGGEACAKVDLLLGEWGLLGNVEFWIQNAGRHGRRRVQNSGG